MNENSIVINNQLEEKLLSLKKNNDELISCIEKVKEIDYKTIGKMSDDISVIDISTMVVFGLIGAGITNIVD